MIDFMTREQRSRAMSRVRATETQLEKLVRSELHRHGFRFRKNVRDLPGSPDIVLPKYRAVVFVHGCFWHGHSGCAHANLPKTNRRFWEDKISANVKRDACQQEDLKKRTWRIAIIWGCSLKTDVERSITILVNWLLSDEKSISI